MPTGIYIDHGGGNVVDMTTRFGQFIGSFDTAGVNSGTVHVPALVGKELLYMTVFNGVRSSDALFLGVPITYNKSTGEISWNYSLGLQNTSLSSSAKYHRVYYGVT